MLAQIWNRGRTSRKERAVKPSDFLSDGGSRQKPKEEPIIDKLDRMASRSGLNNKAEEAIQRENAKKKNG